MALSERDSLAPIAVPDAIAELLLQCEMVVDKVIDEADKILNAQPKVDHLPGSLKRKIFLSPGATINGHLVIPIVPLSSSSS